MLRANAEGPRRALVPLGGRTAVHYGFPIAKPATVVSTLSLSRTRDYPARDMTVTVEAGMRIDDLTAMLHQERQQLPVDVSQSHRATIGGAIATNTSGPRRYGYGTFRDYVIGITAVDARGRLFHAGGQVVKNVAGYDVCKLLVGSLGTLAVITQVTLKLKPLPESFGLLWAAFSGLEAIEAALEQLARSAARPVLLDVLDGRSAGEVLAESRLDLPAEHPVLVVGVEGTKNECHWQAEALRDELRTVSPAAQSIEVVSDEKSTRLLQSLTEFAVNTEEPLTFRASVPPSATIPLLQQAQHAGITTSAHAGNGIVTGHLPDGITSAHQAARMLGPIHHFVDEHRGAFVILHCDDEWKQQLPVFGTQQPAWTLMRRLKDKLDPHNRLNPGRLFPESASPTTS